VVLEPRNAFLARKECPRLCSRNKATIDAGGGATPRVASKTLAPHPTLRVGNLRQRHKMSARVTAQPTMASGAVKIGKSFTGSRQAVGVSGFAGKPLKARAVSMGRRVAAHQPLRVVSEKVVGIDLGTTNSAVRTHSRHPSRTRFRHSSDCRHQRVVWRRLFLRVEGFGFVGPRMSRHVDFGPNPTHPRPRHHRA
jgi:hypothetical protein